MDCSKTTNGFFEFKGMIDGQWESDISQGTCSGQGGVSSLSGSNNHVARYSI